MELLTSQAFGCDQISDINEHFAHNGWALVKLPHPEIIFEARAALQNELRRLTGIVSISLEQYHTCAEPDDFHTNYQIKLTEFYRANDFGKKISEAQLPFFEDFLGPDLCVQRNPFLRITRPGKKQDNIGYHRDTVYGGSPYEVSFLVPYVDVPVESALSVLSGSHIRSESDFPTLRQDDPQITKGSPKHKIGFLYAPHVIQVDVEAEMLPISMSLGEGLLFSLSTVHGSIENKGKTSRWSTDTRIMNRFAPVDLSSRPDYYQVLSRSSVVQQAEKYLQNQNGIRE